MSEQPQRTVPPSVKYTTKELLEKIEAKVDDLHDIRSKWQLLLAFLAIVLGFSGLGKWWDHATIDALKTRIGAQDTAIADLEHRLELHANEAGHADMKCYTTDDTEQDKRIQSIERKLRRR